MPQDLPVPTQMLPALEMHAMLNVEAGNTCFSKSINLYAFGLFIMSDIT